MADVKMKQVELVQRIATKTSVPPVAVRKVLDELVAAVGDLKSQGDRIGLGKGISLMCRVRTTAEGTEKRMVVLRMPKEGQDADEVAEAKAG